MIACGYDMYTLYTTHESISHKILPWLLMQLCRTIMAVVYIQIFLGHKKVISNHKLSTFMVVNHIKWIWTPQVSVPTLVCISLLYPVATCCYAKYMTYCTGSVNRDSYCTGSVNRDSYCTGSVNRDSYCTAVSPSAYCVLVWILSMSGASYVSHAALQVRMAGSSPRELTTRWKTNTVQWQRLRT